MTQKQLEDFKKAKFVINCKTKQEAEQLMKYFDKCNIIWGTGQKASCYNYFWDSYKDKTCYGYLWGNLGYSKAAFYETENIPIKTYSDLFTTQPKITEHIIDEKNGKIVIKLSNGNIGVAKCNFNEDKFDIEVGTKLALERAYKLKSKKQFEPYLRYIKENYSIGTIGKSTNIIDMIGNELKVGDTVTLYLNKDVYAEKCICNNKTYGDFIMGIAERKFSRGRSESSSGSIWSIIKKRSYTDFKHDDKIYECEYVLKEE